MPISYKGVVTEHMAVRQDVGIFDVSHMGRIILSVLMRKPLSAIYPQIILKDNQDSLVIYTVWASESGGAIDDVLVYRQSSSEFFVVVNAANRKKSSSTCAKLPNLFV